MAITYFGRTAVPADGVAATNATTTISFTPPASMVAGDLCVVYLQQRGTATFSNTTTGGQTWSALTRRTTTSVAVQGFWCRFNGTWAANPVFTFSAALATSGLMMVFRPSDTGKFWAVDVAEVSSTFAAPTTPFTVTRAGLTVVNDSSVSLAGFFTADDNTWGTLSGTGWNVTGDAQYRNTAGSDQSMAFAHKIQTAAGATGSVSLNQLTLGGDLGLTTIITFYEFTPPTLFPKQVVSNAGTTGTTSLVMGTVTAGARVAVVVTQGNDNVELSASCSVTSTPTLTWTKRVDAGAATSGNVEIYDTTYTAGGALTINISWGAIGVQATAIEVTGQEVAPSGASATATNQTNPSVSVTTTGSNSLVLLGTSDYNLVDGATRTYRFSETEMYYVLAAASNTGYHYYKIVPTAGTNSFGLTAPTMTGAGGGTAAYEIRVATGANLTAAKGTFTITGNATGLLEQKKIVADKGTFTQTGNATGLNKGKLIVAAQGTFTQTGNTVNFSRTYVIAAVKGIYTQTGIVTGLLWKRLLTAANSSYTLTGRTVNFLRGYLGSLVSGVYTLSGQVTSFMKGRTVTAAQGTFTLTGQSTGVLQGYRLTVSTGSYTETGYAAGLSKTGSYSLQINTGSYSLDGQDTSLAFNRIFPVTKGTFTLTGISVILYRPGYTIIADAGDLQLTGNDINYGRIYIMYPSVGSYTQTGQFISLYGPSVLSDKPTVRVTGWPFKAGFGTTKLK